jgi:hypothetical protein
MASCRIICHGAILLYCIAFFSYVTADMTIRHTSRGYPFLVSTTIGALVIALDLVTFAIWLRMIRARHLRYTPGTPAG